MRQHKIKIPFFALFCAIVGTARGAYYIEPDLVTFNAAVGEKTAMLEVVNTGDGPIAVTIAVLERVLDLDGNLDSRSHIPCKDFIVYPSEIIVHSGKRATVQLSYKAKDRVNADKMYTLFSTEVLMSLDNEEIGGVSVGLPTVVSYYSTIFFDTGKEGKLAFVSSKALDDNNIELVVENNGGGRVVGKGLAIKTSTDIITGFTGTKNSIMPGQKRRFTFRYLRPLTSKEVKFIYDYNGSR